MKIIKLASLVVIAVSFAGTAVALNPQQALKKRPAIKSVKKANMSKMPTSPMTFEELAVVASTKKMTAISNEVLTSVDNRTLAENDGSIFLASVVRGLVNRAKAVEVLREYTNDKVDPATRRMFFDILEEGLTALRKTDKGSISIASKSDRKMIRAAYGRIIAQQNGLAVGSPEAEAKLKEITAECGLATL